MEYILMLLVIGILAGGIAFTSFLKPQLTDEQYLEIRANMKWSAK